MDDHLDIETESDTAETAFEELRGEIALVRHAVQRLLTVREEAPNYSETLSRIAHNFDVYGAMVKALRQSPALALTPDAFAEAMKRAGKEAREADAEALRQASGQLRAWAGSARSANDQRRRLSQTTAGAVLAGILLCGFVPGTIVRAMPENWQWPERMAAHTLDLPMWQAGQRLMQTASASSERVVAGDKILTDNREAVERCRKAVAKAKKPARCVIDVKPASQ